MQRLPGHHGHRATYMGGIARWHGLGIRSKSAPKLYSTAEHQSKFITSSEFYPNVLVLLRTMGRRARYARTRPSLLSRKHRKAPNAALSSKTSRTVINRHHTLQKKLAQAVTRGDSITAEALRAEIDSNGGLKWYQQASVSGIVVSPLRKLII